MADERSLPVCVQLAVCNGHAGATVSNIEKSIVAEYKGSLVLIPLLSI